VPRPRNELSEKKLAQNGDAITPVQCDGTDIEDTGNSSIRTETDQIDDNTEEHGDPDSIQWRSGHGVNFRPESGEGEETVTGEGEHCSAKRLHGCEANELDNDQTRDCEKNTACFSEAVVEDLCNGLVDWAGKDLRWVALNDT